VLVPILERLVPVPVTVRVDVVGVDAVGRKESEAVPSAKLVLATLCRDDVALSALEVGWRAAEVVEVVLVVLELDDELPAVQLSSGPLMTVATSDLAVLLRASVTSTDIVVPAGSLTKTPNIKLLVCPMSTVLDPPIVACNVKGGIPSDDQLITPVPHSTSLDSVTEKAETRDVLNAR